MSRRKQKRTEFVEALIRVRKERLDREMLFLKGSKPTPVEEIAQLESSRAPDC